MNKLKKVFAITAGCLISACSILGSIGAHAESEFGDLEFFNEKDKVILTHHAHPKKLIKAPLCRQATDHTATEACTLSVLRYSKYEFGIQEIRVTNALNANEGSGTRFEKMRDYLNAVYVDDLENEPYFNAELKQNMTINQLQQEIDRKHLVVLKIQAWKHDANGGCSMDTDYSDEWDSGHTVVAVGYNKDNIFFMDPLVSGNYTYIPKNKLLERWHGYEMDGNNQRVDYNRAGVVVTFVGDQRPECERYKNVFYGLM